MLRNFFRPMLELNNGAGAGGAGAAASVSDVVVLDYIVTEHRAASDGERSTFLITTDEVDRYRTIVRPEGVDYSAYMMNPVVLWDHGYDWSRGGVPIGKTLSIERKSHGILATMRWARDDFSRDLRDKVKDGDLSAASLSWRRISSESIMVDETEILVFTKSEMYEWSVVSLPGNRTALVQKRSAFIDSVRAHMYEGFDERVQAAVVAALERTLPAGGVVPAPVAEATAPDTSGSAPEGSAASATADDAASEVPGEPVGDSAGETAASAPAARLIYLNPDQLRGLVDEAQKRAVDRAVLEVNQMLGRA